MTLDQATSTSFTDTPRLFEWREAFDHDVTIAIVAGVAALLVAALPIVSWLARTERVDEATGNDLWQRTLSWCVLVPAMVVPILLGAFWTIVALLILALVCYREFARLTGAFRNRWVHLIVVLGILAVFFAVLDHWYEFFVAIWPLTVIAIGIVGLARDQPKGYVQRTALGVFGFMLCGVGLGHLAYFANDANYRPILLLLLLGIQMNDVFAYCVGKTFGRHRFVPNTSPNKTAEGSLGGILLTMPLVAGVGHFVFEGTAVDDPVLLLGLGLIVSVLGQLGDLMLSAIKRDVGVKDTGRLIPGHGGLLDRFDSTLLTAPAVFHYVGYIQGVGLDQQTSLITG